jgi:hypothetical protein
MKTKRELQQEIAEIERNERKEAEEKIKQKNYEKFKNRNEDLII